LILVHKKVWADLKSSLIKEMSKFKVGNPLERETDMGPVINKNAYESINGFITRAKKDSNCEVFYEGKSNNNKGYFIPPTMILVNNPKHELLLTEIFGPVASFYVYEDINDAINIIKSTNYRLTGAVWSHDEEFLAKYVGILSTYAGNFYVNRKTTGAAVDQQPFGGDGASGTNCKAGGIWYLLQFISQGVITRRHARANINK
jgi:1-pyrroline-5-carboxylate dehydrogenase